MLQKCSVWKVLQVFFDNPDPETLGLSLREISRKSNLAHTSTKKHLQTLQKENLIKTKKKKRGTQTHPVYRPNRNNEKFKHLKTIDTIHRIKKTGLIKKLEKETTPNCIILFGSAAKGEDTKDSDIDLYIQSKEKDLELSKYENQLHRTIQPHFQPKFNQYPPELKNNILNGIILQGYLKAY